MSGEGARAPVVVQPREPHFDETVALAVEHGYELELIHLADPAVLDGFDAGEAKTLSRRLASYQGRLWQHGPFLDLYVNSPDESIRRASEQRIEQSLRIAEAIGAERVVFHTNHLPCTTRAAYTLRWQETSAAFWSRMCAAFDGRIVLENMWDDGPGLMRPVLDQVPRLLACLDTGHANVFSAAPLADWVSGLADRLAYIHLSDNLGDADDALPPGDGVIDWPAFTAAVRRHAPRAAVMIGMDTGGLPAVREALARMERTGIHPFAAAAGKESE
ncbi:hypothetical protein GCM10023336_74480 [Streptomyces similanensis]|uniref:Xylose isomerase-like TIM barrel domain-containing protein n=1 Tax=Streptomyces similanensis TaxID=1274988 RepID=A0ABP9LMP2_9ACTN